MVIDKEDSKVIDILRLPCAILVVFIHVFSIYPGVSIFRVFISQGVARVAVPVFFLTSGYLFFNGIEKWNWSEYAKKIRKRLKTLVLPYLLWNTFFIIWFCLTLIVSDSDILVELFEKRGGILMYWNCNRFDYDPNINVLGWQMWNGAFPINYPLWFIRDLIVINLFSPIVFLFVKRFWAVCVLFILYILDIWIPIEGFRAEGFFFFSLGGYLMYSKKGIVSTFRNYKIMIYIITAILLIFCTCFYKTETYVYFRRCLCLFGSISSFQIAASISKKNEKFTAKLTSPVLIELSFVIFAAHAIGFKPYLSACVSHVLIFLFSGRVPVLLYDIAFTLTPFMIGLLISGLYWGVRMMSPQCCSLLTGGRVKK